MTTSAERYPFRTPDLAETKVLALDSTLGGRSEPFPEVGVDFASPLSQLFITELAVADRPRIFTYAAYEPPGQLIRMVLDEVNESPYPHGCPTSCRRSTRVAAARNLPSSTCRSQS